MSDLANDAVDEFPDTPIEVNDPHAGEPPLDSPEFADYVPPVIDEEEEASEEDVEGADETPAEEEPVDSADVNSQQAEDARAMAAMREQFKADPATALLQLMAQLGTTPEAFAQMMSGEKPATDAPEEQWDTNDGTLPENIVWENRDFVRNGARHLQTLAEQNNQTRALAEYNSSLLEAKVNALLELNGIKLPDADKEIENAIVALTRQGKPIREAVFQTYLPKAQAAIAKHKQEAKPQPKTPGNRAPGAPPKIKQGASLNEVWNSLGRPKLNW